MSIQQTTYVYLGTTFLGEFDVDGEGVGQAVRVRHDGATLQSRAAGLPADLVAQKLLREIVSLKAIARKAAMPSSHPDVSA